VQTGDTRRTLGDRAAPPYTGRGLIEAVHPDTILSGVDPDDLDGHASSLAAPAATNPECSGDCISGRANLNSEAPAFVGADPLIRVGRFGLRAQGPGLFEFISAGGVSAQIGFTSPFTPNETRNPQNNADPACRNADSIPDPELLDVDVLNVRTLLRLLGITALDDCLLGNSDVCESGATRVDVERGAALFGVDVDAFRSRMIPGRAPVGDDNAVNQADRQLNCVGCHVPILATGGSPAEIGARHLSQRWIPIFSDLLMHDMGEVIPERRLPIQPPPYEIDGTFDISRNLADDVLGGQGVAGGREWRTPPLFGIGVIGPPFLHDARVYLSRRSVLPASTVYTNADVGTNARLVVLSFDDALRATIELHDLPPPDDATTPPGEGCAAFVPPRVRDEVCPPDLAHPSRTEARNVMRRWRALTDAEQQLVLDFLRAL
jgi:CxxC motif-containing protein (DUF1111 family)